MALEQPLKSRTILQGDVLEKIKELPDESIDCVITSPPYWGLRDYGVEGQWGLEPDFRDYLMKMRMLMRELKRVLKKTGTCWVNLSDTYSGSGKGFGGDPEASKEVYHFETKPKLMNLVAAKSLYGIPQRFFTQCIDDGWIARNYNIWYKENAIPSSVRDRLSNKYEPVMFFAKTGKYFFDLDVIREKPRTEPKPGKKQQGKNLKLFDIEEPNNKQTKQDLVLDKDGKPKVTYKGFNERWKNNPKHYQQYMDRIQQLRDSGAGHDNPLGNPNGKNPGDVWFINPKPFIDAHFAVFPPELPLKIISCACPIKGFVLDPFFGSGTTGLAAEVSDRNWIGIELKQEYIQIARNRLNPHCMEKLI